MSVSIMRRPRAAALERRAAGRCGGGDGYSSTIFPRAYGRAVDQCRSASRRALRPNPPGYCARSAGQYSASSVCLERPRVERAEHVTARRGRRRRRPRTRARARASRTGRATTCGRTASCRRPGRRRPGRRRRSARRSRTAGPGRWADRRGSRRVCLVSPDGFCAFRRIARPAGDRPRAWRRTRSSRGPVRSTRPASTPRTSSRRFKRRRLARPVHPRRSTAAAAPASSGSTIAIEEVAKYSNTARADAAADPPADRARS